MERRFSSGFGADGVSRETNVAGNRPRDDTMIRGSPGGVFHVKRRPTDEAAGSVASVAERAGLDLPPQVTEAIAAHLDAVLGAAGQLNLTAIEDRETALRLHVADSLSAAHALEGAESVVDLGSGAGYPGIPLALALGARGFLVESRAKRAAFLEEAVGELGESGASISVLRGRAEEQSVIDAAGRVDAVVARAVASLPVLVELAAPYLEAGGRFVAMKGAPQPDEIARGDEAAAVVGLERAGEHSFVLPDGAERRTLVEYRRVRDSEIELPRRVGVASKRPLA
jgi:16S rRNA (guanine527-N7)-methyltransferase